MKTEQEHAFNNVSDTSQETLPLSESAQADFSAPLRVLITGGSAGIGFACAQYLARAFVQSQANLQQTNPEQANPEQTPSASFDLLLTGRDQAKLQSAQTALNHILSQASNASAGNVHIFQCDHSESEQVRQLITQLQQSTPDLTPNAVIANVGINPVHQSGPRKIASTSRELLLSAFQTNVANTHELLSPLFKRYKQQGGKVAIIGSQAYQFGVRGQLAYNVSKAALLGYFNTVASEFAGRNLYCHLINPGVVENQRTASLRSKNPGQLSDITLSSEADVAKTICIALLQNEQRNLLLNV